MPFFYFEALLPVAFILLSLICIAAVVFFERKNPASSIAWILVLLFLPVLGFMAYIFIGSGFRINKKRRYQLKAATDDLYDIFLRKHLNIAEAMRFMEAHQNAVRLMTYLFNEGDGIYTSDNKIDVFTDGGDMFARLIEDLKNAREHIHLLYFIFNNDDIGREIAGILTHKARKGVEVRLIYDSVGSRVIFNPPTFRRLRQAGGQVLGFSPVFSNLSSHFRLNYRNHRKLTIIDGRIGYVGGMNIGDEYMGRHKRLTPWRDTHLRLTGSAVWFLQERFLMDWSYTSDMDIHEPRQALRFFPEPAAEGKLGVQIVSGGPDTAESPIKSGFLTMIGSARKNVYIQTPYFSPDQSFLDALRIAARSDIDVRLMLPMISDHGVSQMSALGYARQVMESGVRVFLYHGFLHAKAMVSDGLVTAIGTTNITQRSFTWDFEINAFVYDTAFAENYEHIFFADQADSTEITLDWFDRKGRLTLAAYNFARLFSPLM